MKTILLIAILIASNCVYAQNPIMWGADPSGIVAQDGRLFIFPTNDKKSWGEQKDWHCWSTSDLKTWTDHGVIFDTKASGWGIDNAWAPDITYKNGMYYFYYYFQNGDKPGGIGVATSKNIEGPYKEALGKRLMGGHDPCIFNDDDGRSFIYYQNNVVELNEDMISLKGKVTKLDIGEIPEKYEAAYVFKRNGVYYYTIAHAFNHLMYYTGDSPMGPFKLRGELMAPYGGNNHHSIVKYGDRWIIFYHEWAPKESEVSNRRICAEWLTFNDDGTIVPVKVTKEGISSESK